MKECVACAEEIRSKARLCRHCGTDQFNSKYASPGMAVSNSKDEKQQDVNTSPASLRKEESADYGSKGVSGEKVLGDGSRRPSAWGMLLIVLAVLGASVLIVALSQGEFTSESGAASSPSSNEPTTQANPRDFLVGTGILGRGDVERIPITEVNFSGFIPEECSLHSPIREILEGGTTLAIGGVRPEAAWDLDSSNDGSFFIHQRLFESNSNDLRELTDLLFAVQDNPECSQTSRTYEALDLTTYRYLGGARPIKLQYGLDLEGVILDDYTSFCDSDRCLTSTFSLVLGYKGELAMVVSYGGADFADVSEVVETAFRRFSNEN